MGALKDIAAAVNALGPVPHGQRRFVLVGESAGVAICAAYRLSECGELKPGPTWREQLPSEQSIPFIPTDAFPGWEVVDRPVQRRGLFK